jgi:segregation and condensation protein B
MEPPLPDCESGQDAKEVSVEAPIQPSTSPRRKRYRLDKGAQPPPAERILEALLFAGGQPVAFEDAKRVITGLEQDDFLAMIDGLNRAYRYQGRPYVLLARTQGYVMTIRPAFRPVLDRLQGPAREARLSAAAVDVLSLVAYRQPLGKLEIDSLRGADSGALIRQLLRRGLVAGERSADAGRDLLYTTTPRFLDLFQLSSLEDLPHTQDVERL